MRQLWLSSTLALAALWPLHALAGSSSQIHELTAAPTINAAGITVVLDGDDNHDAVIHMAMRKVGTSAWTPSHDLLPRKGSSVHAGSLFYLDPAAAYEVQVSVDDPDNANAITQSAKFTTRADAPLPPSGKTIHVDAASGDDAAADGSAAKPYATIGAALGHVQPGDEVLVGAGIYPEELTVPRSGTHDKPIWLKAESGAVLEGADMKLASSATWTVYKDDIYKTSWDKTTSYLAVDDTRIYDYDSLASLEAKSGGQQGQTNVLQGGFYVDKGAGVLYVRLPDGTSPQGKHVYAGIRKVAVLIDNKEHVVIDGFEIRHYGGQWAVGVDLRGAKRCWVRHMNIHHLIAGIRSRKGGGENVIEYNTIRDTSVYGWPWASVKHHTGEASAISLSGGPGDIARHNTADGMFNGVYTGEFSSNPSDDLARNIDVYENLVRRAADDGLEPEGACINQRFWHNVIRGVHNGVSLAPIDVGPVWVIRNVLDDFDGHALKLNNGSTGPMMIYHNTSIPRAGTGAQPIAPSIPFGGLMMRNNIWSSHRYVIEYGASSLAGEVSMDYDDLFTDNAEGGKFTKWLGKRYDDLASFSQGTGYEAHGLSVKPEYVDATGGDFTLTDGSPLLDKGERLAGINDEGLVGEPDIGAYERGGIVPHPGAENGAAGSGVGGSGGSGGTGGDAGAGAEAGASATGGNAGSTAGGSGGSGATDAGSTPAPADGGSEGGCGCRVGRTVDGKLGWFWLLGGLAALMRRRKRQG